MSDTQQSCQTSPGLNPPAGNARFYQFPQTNIDDDGVIYLPGQYHYQQSRSESIDMLRDKSSKSYEHPIKFEQRLLQDTIRQWSRAPTAVFNQKDQSTVFRIQFRPLRQHSREMSTATKYPGEYEFASPIFELTNYVSRSNNSARRSKQLGQHQNRKSSFVYGTTSPIQQTTRRDSWIPNSASKKKTAAPPPSKYGRYGSFTSTQRKYS